jgi:hypothetical protein
MTGEERGELGLEVDASFHDSGAAAGLCTAGERRAADLE